MRLFSIEDKLSPSHSHDAILPYMKVDGDVHSPLLVPAPRRLAVQVRWLRAISAASQIILMAALLVLWKQFRMPFAQAFEKCFVAGVVVYVVLGTAASVLMAIARIQPVQMLLRRFAGIVSLAIFGALHYVYGMGIIKSAAAWAVIYFGARVLLLRIERRAMRHFSGP